MALNIELKKESQFNFITKSLGKLLCRNFTHGVLTKVEKWLKDKSDNLSSDEFARYLITLICQKSDSKNSEKRISQKQADTLTKNEIDKFAKLFIENNEDFLGEQQLIKRNDGKDKDVVLSLKTKILDELLKQDDESNIDHLLKVVERYIKEHSKRRQKIVDKFQSVGNFSNFKDSQLEEALKEHDKLFGQINNFGKLASLKNSLFSESTLNLIKENQKISDRLGSIIKQKPLVKSFEQKLDIKLFKPIENPAYRTNEILSSFDKELKETASLIKNMNDLGVSMAKDFKKSIFTTESWNKKMLRVGIGTLIATLLATLLTAFFTAYFSYQHLEYAKKSSKQANILVKQQNSLLGKQIKQQQQIINTLKFSKQKIEKSKKN